MPAKRNTISEQYNYLLSCAERVASKIPNCTMFVPERDTVYFVQDTEQGHALIVPVDFNNTRIASLLKENYNVEQ